MDPVMALFTQEYVSFTRIYYVYDNYVFSNTIGGELTSNKLCRINYFVFGHIVQHKKYSYFQDSM